MRQEEIAPVPGAAAASELGLLEDSRVVGTLVVSRSGEVLRANARMCRMLGVTHAADLQGSRVVDLLADPEDQRAWRGAIEAGRGGTVAIRLRGPRGAAVAVRGELRPFPGAGPGAVVGIFVDNTAERQLGNALQRSARMEALGSLTAGIAHDFNNLLTVLVGNLSLAAEDVRQQPKVFEKVKAARDAGKRGAELIRQLLSFARRDEGEPAAVIDAGKVVQELGPLLRRALGTRITFDVRVAPGPWPVRATAAQLESVVVNLAVNARDAIDGKGRVSVEVGEAAVSATEGARLGIPAGKYAGIKVSDDGCGIPPELLERVFEPFFSTKTDRGGTGLGLSMVRAFAERSGGAIAVQSAPGHGTTMTLLLPLCSDGSTDATAGTSPLSTLPSGKERVLIVTGDEALRSTIAQILEVLGYSVRAPLEVSASSPPIGFAEAELTIVDAQSFGSEGVPSWLGRTRSALLVLTDNASPRRTGVSYLVKPFSLAELAQAARRALDEATSAR